MPASLSSLIGFEENPGLPRYPRATPMGPMVYPQQVTSYGGLPNPYYSGFGASPYATAGYPYQQAMPTMGSPIVKPQIAPKPGSKQLGRGFDIPVTIDAGYPGSK